MSDLHVQLMEEGFQEGCWGFWFGGGDRPERPLKLSSCQSGPIFQVVPKRRGHDFGPIAEPPLVPFDVGVQAPDDLISEGQAGPALYHGAPERVTELDAPPLGLRWYQRKHYDSAGAPLAIPQGGMGSTMTAPLSTPSLAADPVQAGTRNNELAPRDGMTSHELGTQGPTRAPTQGVGSLSYGDCRHCPSTWPLRDGLVPNHADRTQPKGLTRPLCQGSGETPSASIDYILGD